MVIFVHMLCFTYFMTLDITLEVFDYSAHAGSTVDRDGVSCGESLSHVQERWEEQQGGRPQHFS